ncbi:YbdD/YjiX family protein [Nocardia halotolerans]|uniref:YbdD/YjiX family protein n=1 Tax=Nocardia halotolerans TaxID=1755878 RepID=A0ABV8VL06_9NOCA
MGCADRRGPRERARFGGIFSAVSPDRDADGRFRGSAVGARAAVRPLGSARPAEEGSVLGRVWAAARGVARWYSAINGGQDYQRYVDHFRRMHPGRPVPSEREYWRARYADAERNPTTRCC